MHALRRTAVALLMVVATLAMSASAHAAYPGGNGRIAYKALASDSSGGIHTINPDGTGDVAVPGTLSDSQVVWSPDGAKLAFESGDDIWISAADGTARTRLTNTPELESGPTWSPDGSKLAFIRGEIFVMNSDGTGVTPITSSASVFEVSPAWSPDGMRIAYVRQEAGHSGGCDIHSVAPDGLNDVEIVNLPTSTEVQSCSDLDWAPDASKLVFTLNRPLPGEFDTAPEIYVVNANGTGVTNLTNTLRDREYTPAWSPSGTLIVFAYTTGAVDSHLFVMTADTSQGRDLGVRGFEPDWQPRHQTLPGHPRPQSAGPIRVSLVPAYTRCVFPDRTHGPPLASESCSNPDQLSSSVTVGTSESNGHPANFVGHVTIKPLIGNPGTLAEDADVRVAVTMSDIRRRFDEATDYTGELQANLTLRMTDRFSGATADVSATMKDIPLSIDMQCVPTSAAGIGSSCATTTTADSLTPGMVFEGKRTVWEVSQVRVIDGGEDGLMSTPVDNTIFAKQGIFVP
jgi:hypothetical protein